MAQREVKDYFPSQKLQNRGKNSTRKRRVESLVVSGSKKRKVLTQQPSRLTPKDNRDVCTSLPSSLFSSLSSTTTNPYETPNPVKQEASPVGVKGSTTKLDCFESLPPSVSPLRRGAECVRLALEKKTSSSVSLGKEKAPVVRETRRKLFSSEVTDDPGIKVEHSTDDETPAVTGKAENKPSDVQPAKQSISGVTPLVKKSPDTTISKETPKLKPFTSLQYDSPTKRDKLDVNIIKSLCNMFIP